ncbi:MAG: methyltransferase domain-containing protein [Sphingomonadales bacterium]|nr:methyltransferase domain-containing protein [Sphingomonadales bacterium]
MNESSGKIGSDLSDLLRQELRPVEAHIVGIGAPPDGATYDRAAWFYDSLIGNPLYNRLVWGAPVREYAQGCRRALAAAPPGPVIDLGCGTLKFTAVAYLDASDRQLVLVDRSLAMLRRARQRLLRGGTAFPAHITLLHADLGALQCGRPGFAAALSWGVYHCLPDAEALPAALAALASDGIWAFSSLVIDRRFGHRYLNMLARTGEVQRCVSHAAISDQLRRQAMPHDTVRVGNMAFFQGRWRDRESV